MAKARIGHFVEAQILEALEIDYIDESEVLTPADLEHHVDKWKFTVPFVCGCTNLGEALRRIAEGAAMIRTKGEAGTGDIVNAVTHMRAVFGSIKRLGAMPEEEIEWLYSLPEHAELDGVLYVHGSPLSDVESFPAEPGEDDERMLNGVRDTVVVFGHSHLQFERPGPNGTTLINPGSAGMPLDGDVRAAYALRGGFRLALTGTPVENRLDELWSQLHFTNPGLLGGRSDFESSVQESTRSESSPRRVRKGAPSTPITSPPAAARSWSRCASPVAKWIVGTSTASSTRAE
jgi:hypothetical protein